MLFIRVGAGVILAMVLSACASVQTTTAIGTDFKKANQAAVDAVGIEAKQIAHVRRMSSIVYYITVGTQPSLNNNIDRNNSVISFGNFVCAGADAFDRTNAGLDYTTAYANAVEAIVKTPNDSIAGYVAALNELRSKDSKILAAAPIAGDQFSKCRDDVVTALKPPLGYAAVTGQGEAVGALEAIGTIQAIVSAVNTLVKDGLKIATEAEQKRVLQNFVSANKATYADVLSKDLTTDELDKAFDIRKKTAIAVPYLYFEAMLKLSPVNDQREILIRAQEIDQVLAAYDAIRTQPRPGQVSKLFAAMNSRLQDYADNKLTAADLQQYLTEITKELGQLKTDYDSLVKSAQSGNAAAGGK